MNTNKQTVAFIGGGNMASALIGGLLRSGTAPGQLVVIEPFEAQRDKLAQAFGVNAQAAADERLAQAGLVVWAVKPQLFALAAAPCAPFVAGSRTPADHRHQARVRSSWCLSPRPPAECDRRTAIRQVRLA